MKNQAKILDSLRFWSGGSLSYVGDGAVRQLLDMAVVLIRFRRETPPKMAYMRNGKPKKQSMYRTMLCTMDQRFLKSKFGVITFGYETPKHYVGPAPRGIERVYDLQYQDFRQVNFGRNVEILAVLPTSIVPISPRKVQVDGKDLEGDIDLLIPKECEITDTIIETIFRKMSPEHVFLFMNGYSDQGLYSGIQEFEEKLRNKFIDEIRAKRKGIETERLEKERIEKEKQEAEKKRQADRIKDLDIRRAEKMGTEIKEAVIKSVEDVVVKETKENENKNGWEETVGHPTGPLPEENQNNT